MNKKEEVEELANVVAIEDINKDDQIRINKKLLKQTKLFNDIDIDEDDSQNELLAKYGI